MTEHLTISTLILQHRISDGWAADPWAEVHPLIDGVDVVKEVHPEGFGRSCRYWRGPAESWPLAVTDKPRRVMLTEPTCTADCCGALYVTMRREGDQVIWESWENTSDITAVPTDYRFDSAQYEAELARAAADLSWEEPLDTVARLLEQTLADSGWFERWGCVLGSVSPRREEPDLPEEITSPQGIDVDLYKVQGPGEHGDLYRYELFVTGDHPVAAGEGAHGDRMLNSRSFLASVAGLDRLDSGFADTLTAATKVPWTPTPTTTAPTRRRPVGANATAARRRAARDHPARRVITCGSPPLDRR